MNNEMMLVPRAQLERIQVQLDHAATAFKAAKPERDALRKLLAAAPAAQAAGSDLAAAAEKARDVLRNILRDKAGGVHYAAANAASHQLTAALAAPVPTAREAEALAAEKALGIERLPVDPAAQAVGEDAERAKFERAFVVQEGVFYSGDRKGYRSMNGRSIEETDASDLNLRLSGWLARAGLAVPSQSEQEPVAWMDQDGALHTTLDSAEFSRRPATPLYAAPVRAVRLPERDDLTGRFDTGRAYGQGWNACLDEVARLNAQPAGPES